MKDLLQLVKIMLKEKKAIMLSVLLGFIAAISSVGLLGTGGYLISQAAIHPPLYTLTLTIIFVRFFGLSRAASRYAERYFSHKATFSILGRLRVYFYDKIEPLAPALFSTYRSGDLLSRVVADVDRLQFFFLRVFYPPIVMVIVFITTGMIIYTFSLIMAIVLFFGFIIVGVLLPVIFTFFTKNIGLTLRKKRSQLSVETTEYLFGFTDLRTNLRLKDKQLEIESISKQLIEEQERDNIISGVAESISLTVAYMTSWFVLLVGVISVYAGELNGVYLAMLVLVTLTVFETATPMAALPNHLEESRVASNRLFQITDQPGLARELEEKKEQIPLKETNARPVKLLFENVSFSYPAIERIVLNNVSFHVEPGKKVAIVGPSGSGKSSLLNLLLKYYNNYHGKISLGDQSLKHYDEEEARSLFGVVAQENHFFNDTVRANLLLANPEATDEELVNVLKDVSLTHLSLNTILNEKGLSLSGGERQRLAISRMLLKDAPILLLDEPTTSLDSITEQEVLSVLWPHVKEKSVIYITHRLVGLEKMDEIIVLDKGEVSEKGSYRELIAQKGQFYELKQLELERVL